MPWTPQRHLPVYPVGILYEPMAQLRQLPLRSAGLAGYNHHLHCPVLTTMQAGLATDQLKANASYMTAAYGFSVFAILGLLISGGAIPIALVTLVAINWKFQKGNSAKRFKCINSFENRNV